MRAKDNSEMIQAIVQNDPALLEASLSEGANPNYQQGGITAVHLAVLFGSDNVLSRLVAAGGNVNTRDRSGRAPLHFACFAPDGPKTVRMLLEYGADLNPKDNVGSTPLDLAATVGEAQTVRALVSAGAQSRAVLQTLVRRLVDEPGLENQR